MIFVWYIISAGQCRHPGNKILDIKLFDASMEHQIFIREIIRVINVSIFQIIILATKKKTQ